MKIILSPAKKMNEDPEAPVSQALPEFLDNTEEILAFLRSRSHEELKTLWGCNDKIAEQNFRRLREMDLRKHLTPAILAYEGIAFQYMAPSVFTEEELSYVQEHLRILSAFYGVLRPMDGVTSYRLEMQAKAKIGEASDLYSYWGRKIYEKVKDQSGIIINLASKEYAKCVEKYLTAENRYITVNFCEMVKGKLASKGTYAKMARGQMVRYMAEKQIEDPEELKKFDRMGYVFREDISTEKDYYFERVSRETDDFE